MVNAVLLVRGELKTSVADALEASISVDTAAITTHNSVNDALVNVNAGLFSGCALVALVTLAVVRPWRVDTVSIHTGVADTLIYIDALAADVLSVAHVALAAVAGWGGDAATVQAQVGKVLADVDGIVHFHSADVWEAAIAVAPVGPIGAVRVDFEAIVAMATIDTSTVRVATIGVATSITRGVWQALDAQASVLIGSPYGTHFREVSSSPAAAQVTAALHLGVLTTQLARTATVGHR